MDKERSYAKESYKSNPIGIRFNLAHEKIALMRSKKKTRQQLVDFLLENYVKGENPISERYDPLPDKPYIPPSKPPQVNKTPLEWVAEKREIPEGANELYQKWLSDLDASNLPTKIKTEIKFA
jgi:hypothetical protein